MSNGATTVRASFQQLSATAQVTVRQMVVAVTVSPALDSLFAIGDTATFTAEAADANGHPVEDAAVTWTSQDTTVARLVGQGLVTAVTNGTTAITATTGSAAASARVTVRQVVAAVSVSPATDTVVVGDTVRLAAEAADANGYLVAPAVEFSWESSNRAVATVDATGLVTSRGTGPAEVMATASGVTGRAELFVVETPGLSIRPDSVALAALGDTVRLTADSAGNVVTGISLVWTSSDTAVATVSRSGLVRATGEGKSTISAAADQTSGTAVVTVSLQTDAASDRAALVAFYHAAGGATWSRDDNWLTDAPLRDWHGVRTDRNGRVTHLVLTENGAAGSLPLELGNLSHLVTLDLHRNNLTGQLPRQLGYATGLQRIDLGNNQLSGPIPAMLGRLGSLRHLNVENMWLSGTIPPELGDLAEIRFLNFWHNTLTGSPPPELANLRHVEKLYINDNQLSGTIPSVFTDLATIEEFHWGSNHGLCAPATQDFRAWRRGRDADGPSCDENDRAVLKAFYEATGGRDWKRSGGWLNRDLLLSSWEGIGTDSLGRVEVLDLADNNLTGRLPVALAQLSRMRVLRLGGNPLAGLVPLSLTSLPLREFRYRDTELCESSLPSFQAWLASIGVHEGTDEECTQLTERDILRILYEETGGENWTRSDNWLTDAPLRSWHGIEMDLRGRIKGVLLEGNNLRGSIPPELGQLEGLVGLQLDYNWLGGSIPPELGDLPILEDLVFVGNLLTGTVPPELANLSKLKYLELADNRLEGSIPPELGRMPRLENLYLDVNRLSGPIPPEIGTLRNLKRLQLGSNGLQGPIPPEVGHLGRLEWLGLAHNPEIAGPLPLDLENLDRLTLGLAGTGVCIPNELLEWSLGRARALRCEAIEGSQAYLTQSVQSLSYPATLIAGQEAMLRVFVVAEKSTNAGIPPVRATFFVDGAEVHSTEIPGKPASIPTDVVQAEASLDNSAHAMIPAHLIRPGLEMVIEIDPAGTLDPDLVVPKRIPESGRQEVFVRAMPTFDLTVVPFLWEDDPDSLVVELTAEMEADPGGHRLLWDTQYLLPVGDLAFHAHEPVLTSSNDADELLDEVSAIRVIEGGVGRWMASMSGPATGPWGVAWIPGVTSYVRLGIVDQPEEALTIAHELGHNLSLRHAPCGTESTLDRSYPYPDGSTGAWGLDLRPGDPLLVPGTVADLMSYCVPAWIGEYNFSKAMTHRLGSEVADGLSAGVEQTILLWGGADADGALSLNPAFAVDAPPALPEAGGDYRITGRGTDGAVLFSLDFEMATAADGDERMGFVFAVPFRSEWADALAEITLSGPSGYATIDRNTDRPAVILRDPDTGQVRAILRGAMTAAAAAADPAAIVPGGNRLEVLMSSGIPDRSAWRR